MSVAHGGPSGLVRVTVRTDERTADLALPAAVPLAEIVPEVARTLGALDPATSHLGYTLATADGTTLSTTAGLTLQNVHDGAVLVLTQSTEARRRVYDDVVEAMADAVESTTTAWKPETARRTALVAAVALLALGAVGIASARPSLIAGALAGVVSLVLLTAAVVLARLESEPEIAVVLSWCATGYAAVAGFVALDSAELLGWPLAAAGAAAAVAAGLSALGIVENRLALLPGVIVGVLVTAAGALAASTQFSAAQVLVTILVLATIAASSLPALAMSAVGASAAQPQDPATMPADPQAVPYKKVAAGAQSGHAVFLAMISATGILVILVAPLAVTLGLSGALLVVCVCVVLLTRTRQLRSGSEVAVGLATASIGLLTTALSVLILRPEWRFGLTVVLIVLATATIVLTLMRSEESVTRGRSVEIVELASLVSMLPLYCIAVGIVSSVRS